jgi:hypothetical protein
MNSAARVLVWRRLMRSPLNSPPNAAGSESSTSAAAAMGAFPPADARAARAPPCRFRRRGALASPV